MFKSLKLPSFLKLKKTKNKLKFPQIPYSKITLKTLTYDLKSQKNPQLLIGGIIFLLLLIPLIFFITKNPKPSQAAWFNDSWMYRKSVAITNSGSAQTDFQVSITLDTATLITASKMQSDCDDIRITDNNGKVLPHWIDADAGACNTSTTTIWTKVPSIPTSSANILIYYGNPSASNTESGAATFEYFDDFSSDTSNNYSWQTVDTNSPTNSHNWDSVNHWLEIITGNDDVENPSKSISIPSSGHVKIIMTKRGDYPNDNNQYLDIIQDSSNYYRFRWQGSNYSAQGVYKVVSGATTDSSTETGTVDTDDTQYTIDSYWTPSSLKLDINGTTRKDITTTDTTALNPTSFKFTNGQIDQDWGLIFYNKYDSSITAGSPGSEELSPGPLAHWKLDEKYGSTANDSTQNNNDATITGAEWQDKEMCVSDGCLYFEGVNNDYGQTTGTVTIPTAYTLSTWFKGEKTNQIAENIYILGFDLKISLIIQTSAQSARSGILIRNAADDGYNSVYSLVDLLDNQWHNLTATVDTSTLAVKIYVDGKLHTSNTIADHYSGSTKLNFGSWSTGYGHFTGFMDEPKIYPYVRTAEEVKTDYLNQSSIHGVSSHFGSDYSYLSNGLVGYWRMNESSGDASDFSGNNITLTNVNTTTYVGAKYGNGADYESGSSQYHYVADNTELSITGDLTLSAWIKPESVTASTLFDIAGKWDGGNESYLLSQYGDEIRLYIDSSSNYETTDSTNLLAGTWYHVTASYNSTTQTVNIFVNGELQASTTTGTIPSSLGDDAGRFHVGTEDSTTTAANFYDGIVDNIMLHKRTLSPREVQGLYNFDPTQAAWFNDSWAYRKSVAITNSGSAQTDFQVSITLDTATLITASKMQSDCDDIRITDNDGKLLPHWIETGTNACNTSTTAIWTKVPSIPTSDINILIYYGNPSTTNIEDGDTTFEFFDDFSNASLNTGTWSATGGYSISSGAITITTGSIYTDSTILSTASDYRYEYRSKWSDVSDTYAGLQIADAQYTAGSNANSNALIYLMTGNASLNVTSWAADGTAASYNIDSGSTQFIATADTYYINGFSMDSSDVRFYNQGSQTNVYTGTWSSAPYLWLGYFLGSTAGTSDIRDITVDWVRVRKHALTEPSAGSPGSEELSLSPAAQWKFDEGYGSTTNDSGYGGNNGTITGADWTNDGKFGKALDFVAETDRVDFSTDYSELTEEFTVSAWVQTHSVTIPDGQGRSIATTYDWDATPANLRGWNFGSFGSSDYLDIRIYDSSGNSAIATKSSFHSENLNTWAHVVGVFKGSEYLRLYVNGVLVAEDTSSIPSAIAYNGTNNLRIGSRSDSTVQGEWDGLIDEVKLYSTALTPDQVLIDMNQGKSTTMGSLSTSSSGIPSNSDDRSYCPPGDTTTSCSPVGHWKLDDKTTGSTVNDSSTNGNTLTHKSGNYFGDGSDGDVTISADTSLTNTADGDYVVKQYNSLTIDATTTLTTQNRGKGLFIYVKGDATINGTLSMTARGAYADPVSAGVSSTGLRLPLLKSGSTDTLSAADFAGGGTSIQTVVDNQPGISGNGVIYQIPRTGAGGGVYGAGREDDGVVGDSGTGGQTAGGGTGAYNGSTGNLTGTGGDGAAGTCFSGGSGGGGAGNLNYNGEDAYPNGGPGGRAYAYYQSAGGGAGNPGGVGAGTGGNDGAAGTGGIIWLVVGGNLTVGSGGKIEANGKNGGDAGNAGGGGSGGGSIFALYAGTLTNNGVVEANGGIGGSAGYSGGSGGAGSVNGPTQIDGTTVISNIPQTAWINGKVGNALTLKNESLSATDPSDFDFAAANSFTLEAWAKTAGDTSSMYLITKADSTNGGYKLYQDSSGNYCFAIDDDATWTPDDSTCTSGTDYGDNVWHHVTAIKNGTTSISIYVDGIYANSDTSIAATGTLVNTGDFFVGVDSDGTTDTWNGGIDDIKVYNYARSQAQIAWSYNRGQPTGWWKLDECQGSTAYDSSGFGNNGTITIGATGTQTTLGTCTTSGAWYNGATGKQNGSLKFDGEDDYMTSAISVSPSNGTVSFWVKDFAVGLSSYLFRSNANVRTYVNISGSAITFRKGDPSVTLSSTPSLTVSNWNHIVLKWWTTSGTQYAEAYYNGISTGDPVTFLDSTTGTYITVAAFTSSGTENTSGQFDDVRVYNYALTTQQIKTLYNFASAVYFSP